MSDICGKSGVGALLPARGRTHAAKPDIITLPAPATEHGKLLMWTHGDRHTSRLFSDRKLPL